MTMPGSPLIGGYWLSLFRAASDSGIVEYLGGF